MMTENLILTDEHRARLLRALAFAEARGSHSELSGRLADSLLNPDGYPVRAEVLEWVDPDSDSPTTKEAQQDPKTRWDGQPETRLLVRYAFPDRTLSAYADRGRWGIVRSHQWSLRI